MMITKANILYWFRQDLRLSDNPALSAAIALGKVIPVFILDDTNLHDYPLGGASAWWLHKSLKALNTFMNGKLNVFKGDPLRILSQLIQQHNIEAVFWNRCYEPWQTIRDKQIKSRLQEQGVEVSTYNSSLLWEPWTVLKNDGQPYKVFTPYYKNGCLSSVMPRELVTKVNTRSFVTVESVDINALNLLPHHQWHEQLEEYWTPGEKGASKSFQLFLDQNLLDYCTGRDIPSQQSTSRLSPHLHFGEISPHQLWYGMCNQIKDNNLETFLRELGWREFSYYLLYHFPQLPSKNYNPKFDAFPWKKNKRYLKTWQQGQTGIPIVDAGMRELWQTGYMHNRVRMIVASFLVKNLMIHWKEGARWFWDCLVDADMASNYASWQWVAGSGVDAAPFFRIFNPVLQAKKFDPEGRYIKQWVPELASLPAKYIGAPWETPADILESANIILGKNYPNPIVDLKITRELALEAYRSLA